MVYRFVGFFHFFHSFFDVVVRFAMESAQCCAHDEVEFVFFSFPVRSDLFAKHFFKVKMRNAHLQLSICDRNVLVLVKMSKSKRFDSRNFPCACNSLFSASF